MNWRWKLAQAAEIRWWSAYLNNKPKVEYLEWKTNYWRNLLQQIDFQPRPGARILDAGCGPAGIFTILRYQQVDALDPLLKSYEEKLDHFSMAAYPHVRFLAMPLESFRADELYDTIFCLNAINHVADLQHCLDQLFRFLRPGGHLILSIDAHNYTFFKHIFRLLPGDILHPHQYDLVEYQEMLTQRGAVIHSSKKLKEAFFFDYYVLLATKSK